MSLSKKKKLLYCAILALLPFIFLGLFELGLRLLWPQPPRGYSKRLFYKRNGLNRVRSGVKGRQYSREFDVNVEGNSMGYRNCPGFVPTRRPDIILLGDSYSFGWGVDADDTVTAGIAGETGWNVYNLGMPGDDVFRQTKRLQELKPGRCRAIALLFFDNDLSDNANLKKTPNATAAATGKRSAAKPSRVGFRQTVLNSHVVRLCGRLIDICGLSNFATNLAGFKQLQHKAFSRVMQAHRQEFFKSPAWEILKGAYAELFKLAAAKSDNVIVVRIVPPFVAEFAKHEKGYDLSLCDAMMLKLAGDNGVKYYAFSPADSSKYFYRYDQHLTPAGHKELAKFVLSKLSHSKQEESSSDK